MKTVKVQNEALGKRSAAAVTTSPYRPWTPIVFLLTTVLIITAVLWAESPTAPKPVSAPLDQFSAERAMSHIQQIAQEPHPSGSEENLKVRNYLVEQMELLGLNPEQHTFTSRVVTRRINAEMELTNLRGLIPGTENGKPLLLMTHYDSVPTAPGANDASVSVGALLETARVLQQGPAPRNDIWIVLTDGEEIGLAGAKGFFKEHEEEDFGLIANFEARGSRGASFMFQTSEGNRGLIEEYAKTASKPVGNSVLVDLYKKMPNDTDLTVALEYGHPGINFAFGEGWEAYHTPLDNIDQVSLHTLQHHGENVLSIARHFGNLDLSSLENPDNQIYFNLFGMLFHYPSSLAISILVFLFLMWLGLAVWLLRSKRAHWRGSCWGAAIPLFSGLMSTGVCYLVWLAVHKLWASSMTQFTGAVYDSILYSLVFVLLTAAIHIACTRWLQPKSSSLEMMLGGSVVVLILLAASTLWLTGASYLFAVPLAGLLLLMGLSARTQESGRSAAEGSLLVIFGSSLLPLLLFTSILHIVFLMLPPSIHLFSMIIIAPVLAMMAPAIRMLSFSWRWVIPVFTVSAVVLLGVAWSLAEPGPDRPVYTEYDHAH
ncbi:M28 family peptidase [Paenibacillus sp. JSM ZJ436]|uniref:M28 family peptidase n=1 Tax=Paenibacillus sp. JSM ZJ436 TaxID=3376190 RepID=UPI0037887678